MSTQPDAKTRLPWCRRRRMRESLSWIRSGRATLPPPPYCGEGVLWTEMKANSLRDLGYDSTRSVIETSALYGRRSGSSGAAPYRVRAIDIEEPLVEWLPESDEERRQIGFNNYSRRSTRPDPNTLRPVSFDLVARAVIATDKLMEFETPLNFFRRGCRDIQDRQ